MKVAIRPRVASWFGIAASMSLALAVGLHLTSSRQSEEAGWVEHTQDVLLKLRTVHSLMDKASAGVRGYALTGEGRFLEECNRALSEIVPELQALRRRIVDNPGQRRRLDQLDRLSSGRIAMIEETIGLRRDQGVEAVGRLLRSDRSQRLMTETRDLIAEMQGEEERLLKMRVRSASEASGRTSAMIVAGMVANLAILASTFWMIERQMVLRSGTEESLRQSQDRFRGTFEAAAVGMAVMAPDGRWLEVNRSFRETVGYAEEELLGSDSRSLTHPDDRGRFLGLVDRFLSSEGHSRHLELRYIHKSGPIINVLLSASLVRDEAGRPLHLVAQIEDITGRKHAEEALRASEELFRLLVGGVRDYAILMLDPRGRVVNWNVGAEAITGYQAGEIVGRHFSAFYPDDAARAGVPDLDLDVARTDGR